MRKKDRSIPQFASLQYQMLVTGFQGRSIYRTTRTITHDLDDGWTPHLHLLSKCVQTQTITTECISERQTDLGHALA